MTVPPGPGTARLFELDLLRFVAASAVMAFHFPGKWGTAEGAAFHPVLGVTHYGRYGVHLFFVISGFVILMSVWNRGHGEFAASRFVRLMPAYWLSVLTLGLLAVATGQRRPWEILPDLVLLQEPLGAPYLEAVYWSLWVEVRFYVLILALIAAGTTYRNTLAFMGVWLLGSLLARGAGSDLLHEVLIADWSPYFIGGMALYLVYRLGSAPAPSAFAIVAWILAASGSKTPADAAVITAVFAVMALAATGRLRWLRRRGLVTLGALTYPLYLFHSQVGTQVVALLDPLLGPGPTMAAAVAAALAVAYTVHRYFERPVQDRLRPALRTSLERIRA